MIEQKYFLNLINKISNNKNKKVWKEFMYNFENSDLNKDIKNFNKIHISTTDKYTVTSYTFDYNKYDHTKNNIYTLAIKKIGMWNKIDRYHIICEIKLYFYNNLIYDNKFETFPILEISSKKIQKEIIQKLFQIYCTKYYFYDYLIDLKEIFTNTSEVLDLQSFASYKTLDTKDGKLDCIYLKLKFNIKSLFIHSKLLNKIKFYCISDFLYKIYIEEIPSKNKSICEKYYDIFIVKLDKKFHEIDIFNNKDISNLFNYIIILNMKNYINDNIDYG